MDETLITTYQSRLASRLNAISQKLTDNQIRLTGVATDCIKISASLTDQGDIITRKVEDIDVVSIIFPPLKDIPLKKVKTDTGQETVVPYTFDIQSLEVYAPLTAKLDQDDLLVKFYENIAGYDPYIAIFQVKEMLGTFGARSIIYHKLQLSNYDTVLPTQIIEWSIDMARRRGILKW